MKHQNFKYDKENGVWRNTTPRQASVFGKVMSYRRAWFVVIALFSVVWLNASTLFDLTAQVKGILASANGGTGSAFFAISGPTALRTFTLPDASATVLTSNTPVTVAQGGTGDATLTAHGVLIGNGTGNAVISSAGTATQCFTSNGPSADPTFQTCPGAPTFAYHETPTGTINGATTTFTLAHTPNPGGSLQLTHNGQLLEPAGVDYTLTTNSISMVVAPKTGDTLVASSYTF